MNAFNNRNGSKPLGFDPLFGPWPVEVFPAMKQRPSSTFTSNLNMVGNDKITEDFTLNISSDPKRIIENPCLRESFLGKHFKDKSEFLPKADCFQGTGFGIQDELFYERTYNTGIMWNHVPERRALALQWSLLGVKYVHTGGDTRDYEIIDMWRGIDSSVDITINTGFSNTNVDFASQLWLYLEDQDPPWDNLIAAYNQMIVRNYPPNPTGQPRTRAPYWHRVHLDEPEEHGFNARDPSTWNKFFSALRLLFYGDPNTTSGPCKRKVSINCYDPDTLKVLMSHFAGEIQSGCLTLMPEQYYVAAYGTYEKRWEFWEDIAHAADTNVRADDVDRHREYWDEYGVIPRIRIRPFISPVCSMCASKVWFKMDQCCNPEYLIFDVLHAMELGFAGPSLYLGNGISQEFYNYFILASWLAGCQGETPFPSTVWNPDPKVDGEFKTYGDLYKLLDRLGEHPELFDDLKSALSSKGFTGNVQENPAGCQRQCYDWSTGVRTLKDRGPCCGLPPCKNQPIPLCSSITVEPCIP